MLAIIYITLLWSLQYTSFRLRPRTT